MVFHHIGPRMEWLPIIVEVYVTLYLIGTAHVIFSFHLDSNFKRFVNLVKLFVLKCSWNALLDKVAKNS